MTQATSSTIIRHYRKTFALLQGYDEGFVREAATEPHQGEWSLTQAREELSTLRETLVAAGEATELFAREREDAFSALWGNLEATIFGADAYPSIEHRAAHLLYFVVKNHPFSDGNKRSGAYLLMSYLARQGRYYDELGNRAIKPEGLAALTVLVAESRPEQKELLIELIVHMLACS